MFFHIWLVLHVSFFQLYYTCNIIRGSGYVFLIYGPLPFYKYKEADAPRQSSCRTTISLSLAYQAPLPVTDYSVCSYPRIYPILDHLAIEAFS